MRFSKSIRDQILERQGGRYWAPNDRARCAICGQVQYTVGTIHGDVFTPVSGNDDWDNLDYAHSFRDAKAVASGIPGAVIIRLRIDHRLHPGVRSDNLDDLFAICQLCRNDRNRQ